MCNVYDKDHMSALRLKNTSESDPHSYELKQLQVKPKCTPNLNPLSLYKFPLEASNLYLQWYSIGSISYKSNIYMHTLQL